MMAHEPSSIPCLPCFLYPWNYEPCIHGRKVTWLRNRGFHQCELIWQRSLLFLGWPLFCQVPSTFTATRATSLFSISAGHSNATFSVDFWAASCIRCSALLVAAFSIWIICCCMPFLSQKEVNSFQHKTGIAWHDQTDVRQTRLTSCDPLPLPPRRLLVDKGVSTSQDEHCRHRDSDKPSLSPFLWNNWRFEFGCWQELHIAALDMHSLKRAVSWILKQCQMSIQVQILWLVDQDASVTLKFIKGSVQQLFSGDTFLLRRTTSDRKNYQLYYQWRQGHPL